MSEGSRNADSFVIFSSVSSYWWQTLVGWPQTDPESRAGRWVRHQIQRMLLRVKTGQLHKLLLSQENLCTVSDKISNKSSKLCSELTKILSYYFLKCITDSSFEDC